MVVERAGEGESSERDDELRLARAAGAGDAEARRALALRLMARVRNAVRYVVGGDAEAEDAAQSAMIEILRCAGDYRGAGPLAHWATRVAARVALAQRRRARGESRRREALRDVPAADGPDGPDRDDVLLRRRLLGCFDRLPEERRVTVVLHLVHGLTVAEIAEETAVPVNTAKDRLRVGRQELRRWVLEDPALREVLKGRLP
ncbi:MAG: sigma-70 family RNA polymerase sigma factor [Deltaproteobacteria bacterium]|nr:sigma-70 family RNA polymerase sigma factor [Deltaproteobacteria bacterium]